MQRIFGHLVKIFWQRCQNCILSARGTFGEKIVFLEKKNIISTIISGLGAKIFPTFGEKFSAGLSKLHFTCSDEHFSDFKIFSQT